MNRHVQAVFIEALSFLLITATGTALAQQGTTNKRPVQDRKVQSYESTEGASVNAFMVKKIVGSKVRNMQEEDLGTIEDIVVDIDSGSILYAVIDFGGFLGIGGKLFPVPWESLAPLPSEGIFFIDISKAKLKDAPAFDKDKLPDMGDLHWGTKVADFYEASKEEKAYDYGYGIDLYPGIAQRDPFAKIFNPESMKKISGEVIKVDHVIPEKGIISQMQIRLIVFIDRKEPVPVYLGPQWYIAGPDKRVLFKSGDKVTVTGSWITSKTEPFMIATTLTEGTRTFRLRREDGTPIWSGWERGINKWIK